MSEPLPFVFGWRLALRESEDLSSTEKAVGQALATYFDAEGGGWPGVARLMRGSGFKSRRTVQEALRGLERAALLRTTFRPGTSSLYIAQLTAERAHLVRPYVPRDAQGAQLVRGGAKLVLGEAHLVRTGGAGDAPELVTEVVTEEVTEQHLAAKAAKDRIIEDCMSCGERGPVWFFDDGRILCDDCTEEVDAA